MVSMLQIIVTCHKTCICSRICYTVAWQYCCHPEWIHLDCCRHANTDTRSHTDPGTHTHTHPLSDTSRAISNQSRWLLRSSLNGGPDLRYAALFPPSPNFQATRGKGVWEKWREREHAILLFLNKSSTHLILLPNLQSPETAYSGMRR